MAISIDFLANVGKFLRGTKDAEDALGDVADSLDDLARDARTNGDKLGRGISDGADDAQDAAGDLERKFKDLADTAKRESKSAGNAVGDDIKRGTDRAGDSLDEFKGEAAGTARETAASFDGSADSIVGAFQEVAANAFAGFGPAGAAAGLLAAGGIGIASAAMEDGAEQTAAYKEQVGELAGEFIDAGGVGETSLGYVIDKMKELATETEDGKDNLADLQDQARTAGSDFKDLAKAYAGSEDDLDDLVKTQERYLERLRDETATVDNNAQGAYRAAIDKALAQEKIVDGLKKAQSAAHDAADAEAAYLAANGPELEQKRDAIDSIQGGVDDAAGSWEVYKDKEETALDPAKYLENVQARVDAAAGYAANLETAQKQLSPEAYQYLVDQGIDFAPMLQSILDSGMVDQFNKTFTAAATAGNDAVDGTLKTEHNVKVNVSAPVVTPERDLNRLANKKRSAAVTARATVNTAERDLNRVANKQRTAHIRAQAIGISSAERALNNLAYDRSVRVWVEAYTRSGRRIL